MDDEINYANTGQIIDPQDSEEESKKEPTQQEKELVAFVVDHCEKWREYRDQNYLEAWNKYERIWLGKWDASDKDRQS